MIEQKPRQARPTSRQRVPSWRDEAPEVVRRSPPRPAPARPATNRPPFFIYIALLLVLVTIGIFILYGGSAPSPSASPAPTPLAPAGLSAGPGQYRAFWVDAFHDGFKTPEQTRQLIRDVQAAHMNMIIVQVSKRGDAYYKSDLQPAAEDDAPGYDALADLISQAHAAQPRIEVHAWLATLPIWSSKTPPRDPSHVFNTHGPSATGNNMWLTLSKDGKNFDGANYTLDPGNPAAMSWVVERYLEVVRKYDVDGIHLDLVRYAGNDWGYNPAALARYKAETGLPANAPAPAPGDPRWSQWRRDQVTNLVRQIYIRTIAIKPQVKVSAALIPWGDGPVGENGFTQTSAYNTVLQDWGDWWREGILDIVVPMNYDRQSVSAQAQYYQNWLNWEKTMRATYDRHLIVGPGVYLNSPSDALSQIQLALTPTSDGKAADGVALYSYAQTNNADLGTPDFIKMLTGGTTPLFKDTISTPGMPWKVQPTKGYMMGQARDGVTISASGPGGVQHSIKADASGWWGLANLQPGAYQVSVAGGTPVNVTVAAGKVAEVK